MKFTTAKFTSLFLTSALAVATAGPVTRSSEVVWDPKILIPNAYTVWTAGAQETVTWDTSNAPSSISEGSMVEFHDDVTGVITVLAVGFDLRAGNVTVTVPTDSLGLAHITLFGDSGDNSDIFSIV